ncbi:MAG TPA: VWA domain-containing protein [Verrucomicrobiae bacterium]|nr:VWA domain-containing protein [Verrucomicrobiae bacterium]
MSFASPQFLWLLAVIPALLILFFWWSARARRELMVQFIHARLLPNLLSGLSPGREKLRSGLFIAGIGFLLLALAGPRFGYDLEEVRQRGLDIVVAIDTSKSMLAEDVAPNRLARAKYAALDLMQHAQSDRLGLVAFAGSAFLQCPLTIDDSAFRQSVDLLDVNTLPQGGTALAEAIETALSAFKEGENHKVLVLFSDGEDHDSDAVKAAEQAAREGLRIFTVGFGSAEGELLRVKLPTGQTDYVRDAAGNVVKSRLNEGLLQEVAKAGSGFYLPMRGAKVIETLYQNGLAPLPKSESQERWVRQPRQRYHWPLAIGLFLLVMEMCIPERRPAARRSGKQVLPAAAAMLAAAALACVPVHASPSAGFRDYEAGKFGEALKQFEEALGRKPDDMRLRFNAGAAAYRQQLFQQASNHFNNVLAAPDLGLQQRAYYNLGNTLYQMGSEEADPQRKMARWQEALERYESALRLNQDDADAKFNLEFVRAELEKLKQEQQQQQQDSPPPAPSEAAKKAKAEADQAVRRREYARALQIMESQLKNDPTTAAYSDYIQRLKEVTGVQTVPRP